MLDPENYYEYYQPSVPAAGVMCGIFSLGFMVSLFQTIQYKAKIWTVMLVALAMEIIGYAARISSALDTHDRTAYMLQYCLIILAPIMMAGIVYVVFGRIIFHVVPPEARTLRLLWVPARWMAPIFVGFDIFTLLLQLIGALLILDGTDNTKIDVKKANNGKAIALAGVTLQIVIFGLFTVLAARFHFISRRFLAESQAAPSSKPDSRNGTRQSFNPNWRMLLYAVNFSCGMITIRSIYREVEFAMGSTGYMQRNEWCAYVLDALPMSLLAIVYTAIPPGAYVSMGFRQRSILHEVQGHTETHEMLQTA